MGNNELNIPRWAVDWVKKDFIIIIVCLMAMLACLYTIYMAKDYNQQCNEHWAEQWNEKCVNAHPYETFNENFSIVPKEVKGGA